MEKVEEKLREMLLMQLEQVQENSLELNRLSLSQYEASLARCDAAVQQLEENNRKFNEVILTQHITILECCNKLLEKLEEIH